MQDNEMMTTVTKADKKKSYATASLILGILSVVTLSGVFVLSILAVSFAIASRDPETKKMSRKAKAGVILGIVGIVLLILGVAGAIWLIYVITQALAEGCAAAGEQFAENVGNSFQNSLGALLRFPYL